MSRVVQLAKGVTDSVHLWVCWSPLPSEKWGSSLFVCLREWCSVVCTSGSVGLPCLVRSGVVVCLSV